jgi:hypothetical protein
MVMQAPVAIAVFRGPEFIAEIANDAYLPLVDKTRDEFIGKPMFESVPSVRAAIEPLVREVVRTGKSIRLQEIELTLRRHDRDETCWFNLVYEPLRETDGTVDGFMVTATEVTNQVLARRQAEQKEAGLRKARDQFELSIAAGNVGLWHWDAQNQALNWSRQQEALYGLPAGEFGGTLADFHQFVFPEDLAAMLTNPASDLAQSGEAAYEFRIRRTDGAIRWIQARSRTLYNDNGVLEYITGINIDITEQRRAEEALRESENRLRLALESANMGIHVWNIAENTLYWDDRLREMWDIGPDDTVTYELFVNGLHPEDRQKVQAAVNQALDPQGNGQYVAEYRVIDRKTAAIRWVLATGRVFFENGVPVRLVGTARDITERTEAEEKLRESENRFRVLAETLPQMVWMSEADGRTEYTSGRWKEYFGIEDSQQAWRTKVHPDDQEPIMTAWGKHFAAKLPFRYEVRLQSKDGGYRWHYSIAEPVKNEQGETVKWIGALTDIDDQKTFAEKLEREVAERTRELAAANDELTRSNHDLQQFAHVTSHDLQEPLRKIKVFTGLLQKESDCVLSAQGLLYLDKVRHATERVQAMIDGVLAYSKVRASGQNVEMVDLNAVVANACNDLEILIGQKNARIETEPLPVLAGSPVLLHQLFYNLIHNALKFSRPGVPPLVAVRSLPSKSETVTVEVRDNGIGFEPEYAERIFDTFVRLNPKDTYEGTGLGLALCKKIAQRHGGTIRATATLGQGAVFAVTLPLQQVLNVI